MDYFASEPDSADPSSLVPCQTGCTSSSKQIKNTFSWSDETDLYLSEDTSSSSISNRYYGLIEDNRHVTSTRATLAPAEQSAASESSSSSNHSTSFLGTASLLKQLLVQQPESETSQADHSIHPMPQDHVPVWASSSTGSLNTQGATPVNNFSVPQYTSLDSLSVSTLDITSGDAGFHAQQQQQQQQQQLPLSQQQQQQQQQTLLPQPQPRRSLRKRTAAASALNFSEGKWSVFFLFLLCKL
jgi:hypothetical protein